MASSFFYLNIKLFCQKMMILSQNPQNSIEIIIYDVTNPFIIYGSAVSYLNLKLEFNTNNNQLINIIIYNRICTKYLFFPSVFIIRIRYHVPTRRGYSSQQQKLIVSSEQKRVESTRAVTALDAKCADSSNRKKIPLYTIKVLILRLIFVVITELCINCIFVYIYIIFLMILLHYNLQTTIFYYSSSLSFVRVL